MHLNIHTCRMDICTFEQHRQHHFAKPEDCKGTATRGAQEAKVPSPPQQTSGALPQSTKNFCHRCCTATACRRRRQPR